MKHNLNRLVAAVIGATTALLIGCAPAHADMFGSPSGGSDSTASAGGSAQYGTSGALGGPTGFTASEPAVGDAPAKPKATATQAEKDAYRAAKAAYDRQVAAHQQWVAAKYAHGASEAARAQGNHVSDGTHATDGGNGGTIR